MPEKNRNAGFRKQSIRLCLLLLCGIPFVNCRSTYADSPVILGEADNSSESEIYTAADGNQIPVERLQDNKIEYEELGSLIHAYNLDVQEIKKSTENIRTEYKEIRDYLRTEQASAKWNKNEAKDDGVAEDYIEYASLQAIYSASAKSYNDRMKNLNGYTSNKTRRSMEKQLTNAAQNLMISMQSIALQKEYLETMEELCRVSYENTKMCQGAGLATDQDVTNAYNSWLSMSVSLDSLSGEEDSLYHNLCMILGVDGSGMETQPIPSVNLNRLDDLNLEENTKKAINNNAEIISERNIYSTSTASDNKKSRTLNELEEKITVKMQQLYEDIMQAKQSYDAANTGYTSAHLRMNQADQKHIMGMLSDADYLQEKMQYIRKKTAFDSADLRLLQALETYDWAVQGIMSLDESK
ncbi:MAG: TolC family protein [Brotaphodocola sp.]